MPTAPTDAPYDEGARKRLAIFCDGTWNDLRMPSLTNVARLAKCVSPRGWDGLEQVVFYDAGVGVATGVSPFVDRLVTLLGGAIGSGLDDKIESAYRFLVLNYQPGDEIFIFGFSRGAYTARSLCGLIRKCGIVRRGCFDKIPEAMRIYRDKTIHPSDVRDFRATFGARIPGENWPIATGPEDLSDEARARWAERAILFGRAPLEDASFEMPPPKPPPVEIYRMMYLGLWDTVGSLGVPPTIPFVSRWFNRRYGFHDTRVSSLISSLRHAAAIDEDRKVFDVTDISNVHDLNIAWSSAHGLQVDHPEKPGFVAYPDRPFQQRWFPGAHGSVGGGNLEPGLSSGALVWVAVGALRAGLKLDWNAGSELAEAKRIRTPLAPWRIRKDGTRMSPWEFDFLGFLGGYRDRRGPLTRDELQWAAQHRVEACPDYRPATLERLTGARQKTPPHRIVARVVMAALWLVVLAAAVFWLRAPVAHLLAWVHGAR